MKKILAVISIVFFCILAVNINFERTQAAIGGSVIRFHVIANSDTKADQALKLKVRDRVIYEMNNMFDKNGDISSARLVIEENIDKIKEIATDEIKKNGYSYTAKVSLGKDEFPTKDYGEIILPAGSYEALKIEIGNADGKNWWCVLFPPLCFVDESTVLCSSEAAKSVEASVGDKGAPLVNKKKTPSVELRFKSYEIWQRGRQRITALLK